MSSSCLLAQLDVFEAAERYQKEGIPLIILAGKEYGSGNSRDWVAKGPYLLVKGFTHIHALHFQLRKQHDVFCLFHLLMRRPLSPALGLLFGVHLLLCLWQGVRAVIAESFEKLHKNQLVGMGIMPLQFLPDQSADSLELSGKEKFTITVPERLSPRQQLTVKVGMRL